MTATQWACVIRKLPTRRILKLEDQIRAMSPEEHALRYPGVSQALRLEAIEIVKQERIKSCLC